MRNNDFYWLTNSSKLFLSRGYLKKGETVQERIREIADAANKYFSDDTGDRFYDHMSQGCYSLSTPLWTNFLRDTGLPISCFGQYIDDTMLSILDKHAEMGMMSKMGGGTSAYFGDLRPRGSDIGKGGQSGTSFGPVHFMQMYDVAANVVSQGSTRRGSFAAYLPIEHPDILEFLQIREPGNKIQKMSMGVCVSNAWMEDMINGDSDKQWIWTRVIKKRFETGYPYIFFTDNVNDAAPQWYKDKGKKINASNLCSEICLSTDADESFVCNLASMNLDRYDYWKDTDAVNVMIRILDMVMEEFIEKTEKIPHFECANKFAREQRALGLGALGWHDLLQSKMIPFESFDAMMLNSEVFQNIREKADQETRNLAKQFGEPELLKGYGVRNATLMAIAPTTSSSFILGSVSPGIEPHKDNYYVKDIAKGGFAHRNKKLEALLEKKGKNDSLTWRSILLNDGDVTHLDFLTQHEKDVFKPAIKISQLSIIQQAAQRQKYIDQSQSLNTFIHPMCPLKEMNALLITAWRLGVKTLYYQRGINPAQEAARELMSSGKSKKQPEPESIMECSSCEA